MSIWIQGLYTSDYDSEARDDGDLLSEVRSVSVCSQLKLITNTYSNFACYGQDYCISSLPTISTMTYTDSTLSTESPVYAITATPIQIRFRASESTVVPIATDSLKLPMPSRGLDTKEKVGIGIGVPVAVGIIGLGLFFAYRWYMRTKAKQRKGVFEGFGVDLRGRDGEGEREREAEREAVGSQNNRDDALEMEIQRYRREMDPPPAYEK